MLCELTLCLKKNKAFKGKIERNNSKTISFCQGLLIKGPFN